MASLSPDHLAPLFSDDSFSEDSFSKKTAVATRKGLCHEHSDASAVKNAAKALLDHPALWQAGKLSTNGATLATGYTELDQHLAGGFPGDGLTELMVDGQGIGELQLLVPAMRRLSQTQDRWIVWINPPHRPYAPALRSCGVDIEKVLVIHPKTAEEALWTLEKVLQSGSSSMALAWIDERQLSVKNSRRLQLAAKQGGQQGPCLSVLFRPTAATAQPSMASLRLQLKSAGAESLQIDISKRRGGWPRNGITVDIEHAPSQQAKTKRSIGEQLMLWRELNTTAVIAQPCEEPALPYENDTRQNSMQRPPGRTISDNARVLH